MWCSHCRQDVPGISSAKGRISCARCASQLPAEDQPDTAIGADLTDAVDATNRTDPAAPIGLYPSFEDWQTDQAFHHLQARVGNWKRSGAADVTGSRAADRARRGDRAHAEIRTPHPLQPKSSRLSLLAWPLVLLGVIAVSGGALLVGCSLVENRLDLWNRGLPILVVGQAVLLMGLIVQLERVGQNGRNAVRKLEQVDGQLQDLERAATRLNVTHGSASQAFYAHMADQTNPEMLLADLKGQLDLLTTTMSKRSA